MGEKFSLKVEDGLLKQLVKQQLNISGFLSRLFGPINSPDYRAMCEGLVAYHNKDGGSPEVAEFEIIDSGFNVESLSGYCKCKFGIHFHYTCSDVHNDATDTIRWDFALDTSNRNICFNGEEPWVRDVE
ncbi:hypothetical protein IDJ77_09555 [Mucilaginibacter sp. ZT4R22]|uniref:Uncharacterized protein n=1 Tax=Mucilaginibacter pankratovii TaxID=2772110 RepID=A0ABR7WPG1_9SPHI|nr:hypothetical protein [Mucilaginibacter pankratovii]MBD1364053.1 hypothetical protein [Mucilaginibacter pankratovii]